MGTFWERIAIEKRGQVYNDLYDYQMEHHNKELPEPKGLRGEAERLPDVINAPLYEEEQVIELDKEVRKTPSRQERVE
jgi:hypothetical protein